MTFKYNGHAHGRKHTLILLVWILSLGISAQATGMATMNAAAPFPKNNVVVKIFNEKESGRLKVHAGLLNDELYLTTSQAGKGSYQLFFFDMSGKLVAQSEIRHSEPVTLQMFEKGHYFFEVLNRDDRIQYGSIIIR